MKFNLAHLTLAVMIAASAFSCTDSVSNWEVFSPDANIRVSIQLEKAPKPERLFYTVAIKDGDGYRQVLEPSPLGIERSDARFVDSLSFLSSALRSDQSIAYPMVSGGRREYVNRFNEVTLSFENPSRQRMDLVFRAFDNGAAFRYSFPERSEEEVFVLEEKTGFDLGEGHFWGHPYDTVTKWNPAYETYYSGPLAIGTEAPWNKNGWAFPLLFETAGHWVFISESGFDGSYGGSHLHSQCPDGLYTLKFAEAEEAWGNYDHRPHSTLPWQMPWRFVTVGRSLGDIVSSHLVTDLAASQAIEKTDWVRPGRASWSWWSDGDSPQDFERLKPFVDLAADMGWEYSLVDANWNRMKNGTLTELATYAAEKGVGLLIWYNSGGKHNTIEEAPRDLMDTRTVRRQEFARISSMGIKGIKVDFFQSDKQDIIRQYIEILEDAADFRLVVNFHGCTLPKGWRRTYPNLLTMEAVRGGECYRFDADYPEKAPAHLATIPFVRGVAGPADYTPGGFSNSTYPHLTTYGFELALPVVIESGIIHYTDTPEKIKSLPPFAVELLKKLPATWEDTRYLAGYPGKEAVIARRNGDRWYIGGINGEKVEKTLVLDLAKLGLVADSITVITDGTADGELVEQQFATDGGSMEIQVAPFGGFAALLNKGKENQ